MGPAIKSRFIISCAIAGSIRAPNALPITAAGISQQAIEGHLYNLAHIIDRKSSFFVPTIFGVRGGIGAEIGQRCLRKADSRFPVWRRLRMGDARCRSVPNDFFHSG
jgi:hypothetical protein